MDFYGFCAEKHIICNFISFLTLASVVVTCFSPSSDNCGIASSASPKNDFAVVLLYNLNESRMRRMSMLACRAPFALKRLTHDMRRANSSATIWMIGSRIARSSSGEIA